jgi:hypothetical protein
MKKVLVALISLLAVAGIAACFLHWQHQRNAFTSWVPLPRKGEPTVTNKIEENIPAHDEVILGTTERPYVYFIAKHLSHGDGPDEEVKNIDVWSGSPLRKGDTVTVSLLWGHYTYALVDTIQYRYEDYYHYYEYYFIAKIIDTLDYTYFDRNNSACVVIPGECALHIKTELKKKGNYTREESNLINKWVMSKYSEMLDTFNRSALRSVTKDTISRSLSLDKSQTIYLLMAGGDRMLLVAADWSKDYTDKKFGFYALGAIADSVFEPYWLEKWVMPGDDNGYIADVAGILYADSTGRLGIVLHRSFYEGRDIQMKVLSHDMRKFESESSVLTY